LPSPTFTVLLGAVHGASASDILLFQAPNTGTVVLRDYILYNGHDVTAASFNLYVVAAGSYTYVDRVELAALTVKHQELRQVLPKTSQLRITCSGVEWTARATGYFFEGSSPVFAATQPL
jgi:hypothetical protein